MSGMQGKAYTLLRHNLIIQIFIDVDCSSITYDTTPSEAILAAAEKAKKGEGPSRTRISQLLK